MKGREPHRHKRVANYLQLLLLDSDFERRTLAVDESNQLIGARLLEINSWKFYRSSLLNCDGS